VDREERLTEALVRTTFHVTAVMTRIAAEHDLSLTQVRVLGIVSDRRVRVTDLAARTGLDKSTMSGLVDRAVARGLLRRERSPHDGRVVEVVATEAGARLVAEIRAAGMRELAPMVDAVPPAERVGLARLLDTALAAVGQG
jgi:DNA-binding MarR family transcriptional regulator